MDLLHHGASKVHALGFDFLRSGYYNEKAIDLHVLQSGWHNTSNLKKFLHDLLGKEKRFSADPHLKSILDSEFFNNFDHEKTFNLNLKNECKKFLHPYSQPLLLIRSSNRFPSIRLYLSYGISTKLHQFTLQTPMKTRLILTNLKSIFIQALKKRYLHRP